MIYAFISGAYGRLEYTKSPEFPHVPFMRNLRIYIFRPPVTKSLDFLHKTYQVSPYDHIWEYILILINRGYPTLVD